MPDPTEPGSTPDSDLVEHTKFTAEFDAEIHTVKPVLSPEIQTVKPENYQVCILLPYFVALSIGMVFLGVAMHMLLLRFI